MFFLHCIFFVKLMSWLLHSAIHQLMWYFGAFIVNPFSLLWSIFFSRKLYFLWSPCLLFIAESISVHTSDKPTVGFLLKITFPSWIILSISFDEPDSVDWLLRSCWGIFLKQFLFCCSREDLFEYYSSNTIVDVNFISDLKFEYYFEYYTLKYYYKQALNKKLKLIGGTMKYFVKKLLGHEIFRSMVSLAMNRFLKNL